MFRRLAMPQGILFDFVDATDPSKVEAALRQNTKV